MYITEHWSRSPIDPTESYQRVSVCEVRVCRYGWYLSSQRLSTHFAIKHLSTLQTPLITKLDTIWIYLGKYFEVIDCSDTILRAKFVVRNEVRAVQSTPVGKSIVEEPRKYTIADSRSCNTLIDGGRLKQAQRAMFNVGEQRVRQATFSALGRQ